MMAATLHSDPSSSAASEAATSRPSSCSASSLHFGQLPLSLLPGWLKEHATLIPQCTPGILLCKGPLWQHSGPSQLRHSLIVSLPCCWACEMADLFNPMPLGSTTRHRQNKE